MMFKTGFLLLTLLLSKSVAGVETIIWDGVAASIEIAVGVEQVIRFEHPTIQVGVPIEHRGITSAESINGVVYLRSAMAFDKTRYRFREKDSGTIYLIDIAARQGIGQQPPIFLKTPDAVPEHSPPEVAEAADTSSKTVPALDIEPVRHGITTLVRYAMQQVYAPARLVTPLPDLYTVSFDSTRRRLNLVPGVQVQASILGQWRNEDRYVTAIYLQNMTHEYVDLDPRYLTGRHTWTAAALMNYRLTAANSFGDATTLVTVSNDQTLQD